MYISVSRYMDCATLHYAALRYAMQVFCGRLGMHSIIGICGPLWWTVDRWTL